uniref:DUF1279 domain-containing protein n=1 Tax=Ditylenchus dipsaci TaxID=166011 RepID=A0A915DF31_9BILA
MIRSLFRCSGARSCLLNPARPSVSFNQFALESRLQQIQKSSEILLAVAILPMDYTPSSGVRRNLERFQLVRSQEKIERQQKEAERMEQEAMPTGLFAKLKYYLKRYAYIAIPVHMTCCTLWAIVIYLVVKSGVDVIAFLEFLHIPDKWIEKIKNHLPVLEFGSSLSCCTK